MTLKKFIKLSRLWKENESVSIRIPSNFNEQSVRLLSDLLLECPEEELAVVVLEELAEMECCPMDIVEKIFDKGDIACKVAVALRSELNIKLIKKCLSSDIVDVREHFLLRRTKRGTLRKRHPAEWMYRQKHY